MTRQFSGHFTVCGPFCCRAGLALLALAAALTAPAAAHEDITLLQDASGKLQTGISEHGSDAYTFPVRVYERGFDEYHFSNDPGFTAPASATGLPAGLSLLPGDTAVSFDLRPFYLSELGRTNLAYWDGTGDVEFAPVASGYSLTVATGRSAVADGSAAAVEGFSFGTTGTGGDLHEHLNFTLGNSLGDVAEGIYLWSMDVSMPGLETSDQFFILHETSNAPLVLDDAVAWADANVAALTVPEPSSAVLLLLAIPVGLGLRWRRRWAAR